MRTRKGVFLGKTVGDNEIRGEVFTLDPKFMEDPKMREDIFHSLRMPGRGFVIVPVIKEDAPSKREVELEKLLADEKAKSEALQAQLDALVIPDTKRKPGRPKKD